MPDETTMTPSGRDLARESEFVKKIGADPLQLGTLDQKKLYEGTYTPDELKNIPEYQNIAKLGTAQDKLTQAEKAASGSSLGVLEEALRTKTDVGMQKLGQSELYKQAGLTGMATLSQSLNERGREMQDRYGSFVNQLNKVSGKLTDDYNVALNEYNRLNEQYQLESQRFQKVIDNIQAQERQMELLNKQDELLRQQKKEEYTWNSDLMAFTNSYGDVKQAPPEVNQRAESWKTGDIKSANSSDISGITIVDEYHPHGDNCAIYVQTKEGFEWVPAGMGNVKQREENIRKNGHTDPDRAKIGDVILTSEGTQVDDNGIPIGHTAIVIGFDGDNMILEEANYKGGKVTKGRKLSKYDDAIIGFLPNPQEPLATVGASASLQAAQGPVEGYSSATEGENIGIEEQYIANIQGDTGTTSNLMTKWENEARNIGITEPKKIREFAEKRIEESYKPLTEAQNKDLRAYGLMKESNEIYNSIINEMNSEELKEFVNSVNKISELSVDPENTLIADILSQVTDNDKVRRALLAQGRWVNAKLRAESGAAISVGEYLKEGRLFFPRTGDTPEMMNDQNLARYRATEEKAALAGPGAQRIIDEVNEKINNADIQMFATDEDIEEYQNFATNTDFSNDDMAEIDKIWQ